MKFGVAGYGTLFRRRVERSVPEIVPAGRADVNARRLACGDGGDPVTNFALDEERLRILHKRLAFYVHLQVYALPLSFVNQDFMVFPRMYGRGIVVGFVWIDSRSFGSHWGRQRGRRHSAPLEWQEGFGVGRGCRRSSPTGHIRSWRREIWGTLQRWIPTVRGK